MSIQIKTVNIEDAGPVSQLNLDLGRFNLIYGHNEQGKTFLVEFMLKSLFKNLSGWSLRSVDGRGKVVVDGLGKTPVSFMPSSDKKLDDYLDKVKPGLPPKLSRLLVVKGAELDFDSNGSSINKKILKDFLSGQGVIDTLQSKIPSTIQKARIEDGTIHGHQRGDIRNRSGLLKEIEKIDALFSTIDEVYSAGKRHTLETEIENLQTLITELESAKKHQAYLFAQSIQENRVKQGLIPLDKLDQLKKDFEAYRAARVRINKYQKNLEKLQTDSEHYAWLNEAIAIYEQRQGNVAGKHNNYFLWAIVVLLIIATISGFLGFPLGTLILIVIAMVLGWLYLRQMQKSITNAVDSDEIQKLESEFKTRFKQPLTGLPAMQQKKKQTEEAFYKAQTLNEQIAEEKTKAINLQNTIEIQLQQFTKHNSDPEQWATQITALQTQRRTLEEEKHILEKELAALGVSEQSYLKKPATVVYDALKLAQGNEQLAELEEALRMETDELKTLKQRICQETGDDISTNWEPLIENLQQKRQRKAKGYRDVTARLLASILVNDVLEEVRSQEDEVIRKNLAKPGVGQPIFNITHRYDGVRYHDDQLYVSDAYGEFKLSELSTGAREQTLLGLRLGFAAQILDQEQLFLILDDAFQHSDWKRRPWLLDQMVDLAKSGWQIIYFTMDDHIKQLFDQKGTENFGKDYRCFNLTDIEKEALPVVG